MIMAGLLHHDEALLQWTIDTNTLDKGPEAFSRLLKKEGWTVLEVLVTFQQGFRDKTSHLFKFPDIYANVDRFVRKHGQGFEIRAGFCSVSHWVVPFSLGLPTR